jgi:hypothetical protein
VILNNKNNWYSILPKVLQHVTKSLYNQPKPYFFKKNIGKSFVFISFCLSFFTSFCICVFVVITAVFKVLPEIAWIAVFHHRQTWYQHVTKSLYNQPKPYFFKKNIGKSKINFNKFLVEIYRKISQFLFLMFKLCTNINDIF